MHSGVANFRAYDCKVRRRVGGAFEVKGIDSTIDLYDTEITDNGYE